MAPENPDDAIAELRRERKTTAAAEAHLDRLFARIDELTAEVAGRIKAEIRLERQRENDDA